MSNAIHLTLLALVWIAVVTSLFLWTRFLLLCGLGKAHPRDLLPAQPRQRPFWTLADFLVTFGALLLGLLMFTNVFVQQGWIERPVAADTAEGSTDTAEGSTDTAEGSTDTAEGSTDTAEGSGDTAEGSTPSLQSLVAGIAANSLAGIFSVIVTLLWLSLLNPRAIEKLQLFPRWQDIRLGLRASLWILPPVGLISLVVSLLVPYEHPVLDTLAESPTPLLFVGMFVGTAIVAPLVEEFMFRVILQGGLEGVAGVSRSDSAEAIEFSAAEAYLNAAEPTNELADAYRPPPETLQETADAVIHDDRCWAPVHYWPMVVTSVVFALMHMGQGAAPIPLFVLSLGLGYLYRQTGRITAPLVVHMVLNTITLCAEFTRLLAESPG